MITATTADHEINETEFPHALAEVCRMDARTLDQDGDGQVSGLGGSSSALPRPWKHGSRRTNVSPTEHALLDDNGDHRGTERPETGKLAPKDAGPEDGTLARQTVILRTGSDRSR